MIHALRRPPEHRFSVRDVLAGLSVALVLIPQSMAYAELAGLPGHYGLYAGAVPSVAAAFFASSPYLQTGPVATTSLLTFVGSCRWPPRDRPTTWRSRRFWPSWSASRGSRWVCSGWAGSRT